jgi:hypothetical protein
MCWRLDHELDTRLAVESARSCRCSLHDESGWPEWDVIAQKFHRWIKFKGTQIYDDDDDDDDDDLKLRTRTQDPSLHRR